MNLCCTALLASRQRSLTREQLTEQLNCYLDLMRNVPYFHGLYRSFSQRQRAYRSRAANEQV